MLAPESYFFFRSAASFSRAAPVTRLPFFRVSATRASSWEMRLLSLMITPTRPPGHPFDKVDGMTFPRFPAVTAPGAGNSELSSSYGRPGGGVKKQVRRGTRARTYERPGAWHGAYAGAVHGIAVRAVLTQMMDHASAE
ncbi:hypothetical protein GCM10009544_63850 [Streptomyces stramineus]|uniref:Uncharacterized protein n=1 Tax=Streptomyces stramineus TaxID=173861 RepID=A0ABP3L9A9_9ACTN